MPRALKVFRTAAGFHDAYVAAPSRRAALEAWGATKDLFAIGSAELVTDPELTAEPLKSPGKVIKRSRGSLDEQLAALPKDMPKLPSAADGEDEVPARPKRPPSRAVRDRAEAALRKAEDAAEAEVSALRQREAELQRERQAVQRKHDAAIRKLEARVAEARDRYESAFD